MTAPRHTIWFENQFAILRLANGEELRFPRNEPGRLMAYLAGGPAEAPLHDPVAWEQAVDRKMAEARARKDAADAADRRRVERQDAARMAKKDAERLLALVGL